MDADGKPTYIYDEDNRRQIGSAMNASQDFGFTSARRFPLKNQHSLDSPMSSSEVQLSSPPAETQPSKSNVSATSGSTASLSSGVADSWLLNVTGFGRSFSWGNLMHSSTTHREKQPESNHHLSIVPETQSETTDSTSNQSRSLAGSKSCQVLPVVQDATPHEPLVRDVAPDTSAAENRGAIIFSARDTVPSPMTTSQKATLDHFSFFGLPRRINVSKRELNMMTPSSF